MHGGIALPLGLLSPRSSLVLDKGSFFGGPGIATPLTELQDAHSQYRVYAKSWNLVGTAYHTEPEQISPMGMT
eukprot:4552900-Amphidinium_carterae.1